MTSLKKSYPLQLAQPQAYLDQVQKAPYNRRQSTKQKIQEINSLLKGPPKPSTTIIVLFRLMGNSYREMTKLLDCHQTRDGRNLKKDRERG